MKNSQICNSQVICVFESNQGSGKIQDCNYIDLMKENYCHFPHARVLGLGWGFRSFLFFFAWGWVYLLLRGMSGFSIYLTEIRSSQSWFHVTKWYGALFDRSFFSNGDFFLHNWGSESIPSPLGHNWVAKATKSKELNNHHWILHLWYRSGTVNSKSFVGKVFLRIKRKFELIYAL